MTKSGKHATIESIPTPFERNKLSHDYTTPLSEEEYENVKVDIFSEREALAKKQEEIDAFQREVDFEKAQLDKHETAVDEQFASSYDVTQLTNIVEHLNSTYDFEGLPEGATVTVALSVPRADGSFDEYSIELETEEPQEEPEVDGFDEVSRALGGAFWEPFMRNIDEMLGHVVAEEAPTAEAPTEQEPTFEVAVSLEEAFPELRDVFSPNGDSLEALNKFFGLGK